MFLELLVELDSVDKDLSKVFLPLPFVYPDDLIVLRFEDLFRRVLRYRAAAPLYLLYRFGLPLKAIELFHEVWQVDLYDVLSASAILALLKSELPHFEDVWLIMHRSESHKQVELPG